MRTSVSEDCSGGWWCTAVFKLYFIWSTQWNKFSQKNRRGKVLPRAKFCYFMKTQIIATFCDMISNLWLLHFGLSSMDFIKFMHFHMHESETADAATIASIPKAPTTLCLRHRCPKCYIKMRKQKWTVQRTPLHMQRALFRHALPYARPLSPDACGHLSHGCVVLRPSKRENNPTFAYQWKLH